MKADFNHNGGTAANPAAAITVFISPVIEREFKRRDIFAELRLENARRIQNGATGVHDVSVELAKALLADAKVMQNRRDLPRGTPLAYTALVRNVGALLRQEARRGLWADPGYDEMKKRAAESPARFQVGDTALYFNQDNEYGQRATVVGEYKLWQVATEFGPYINDKGERSEYKPGYVIQTPSDERCFVPAHALTRDDCQPAHICLVAPATAGARGAA